MSDLDNPFWQALCSRHRHLAVGQGGCRRYPSDIAPFAGLSESSEEATASLLSVVSSGERVGVLNVLPVSWSGWKVQKSFDVAQYVRHRSASVPDAMHEAVRLGRDHLDQMRELTGPTYSDYFRTRTADLGEFYGIFRDGRLCAMAGTRISLDNYQELASVCTHPDYRGNGFASRLSKHIIRQIEGEGDLAILHTEVSNTAARSLYERLGFTLRKVMPFVVADRL